MSDIIYLDVRQTARFVERRLNNSVSIPLEELGGRLYEMPPPPGPLHILASNAEELEQASVRGAHDAPRLGPPL